MKKGVGSGVGSGSGSISQRYGSKDPDPHQNVTDPQHWFLLVSGRELPPRTELLLFIGAGDEKSQGSER
jgi:hypothetical protein